MVMQQLSATRTQLSRGWPTLPTRISACLTQHEVRHNVQGGLDHVSAVGRLAAGGLRSLEEWGHAVSGDHIADGHRRSQQRSIDGERVTLIHAHGSRIAHQFAAGGIRWAGTHPPLAEAREQVDQCRDAGVVGIVDDKFADPSLKQGDRDRAACAASADEEYPRSLRLSSMVLFAFTRRVRRACRRARSRQDCGG